MPLLSTEGARSLWLEYLLRTVAPSTLRLRAISAWAQPRRSAFPTERPPRPRTGRRGRYVVATRRVLVQEIEPVADRFTTSYRTRTKAPPMARASRSCSGGVV